VMGGREASIEAQRINAPRSLFEIGGPPQVGKGPITRQQLGAKKQEWPMGGHVGSRIIYADPRSKRRSPRHQKARSMAQALSTPAEYDDNMGPMPLVACPSTYNRDCSKMIVQHVLRARRVRIHGNPILLTLLRSHDAVQGR